MAGRQSNKTKQGTGTRRSPSGSHARSAATPEAGSRPSGLHTEREDHPWEIRIPDHPQRKDSPLYVKSRKLMNAIVAAVKSADAGNNPVASFFLAKADRAGNKPLEYQDHHGGGLWVKDDHGWLFVKNLAGMEWSQQFCADPAKVEYLRQFAGRVCAAFPQTVPALKALANDPSYPFDDILHSPIKTAADVSRWVDSIFNANVPLYVQRHTGVLQPNPKDDPTGQVEGGVHHYPTPITDIQLFKHDDFVLWVVDGEGKLAAVTPAYPRGSGRSELNVAYATPGTKLHKQWLAMHLKNRHLQFKGSNPMAKQAFRLQSGTARNLGATAARPASA